MGTDEATSSRLALLCFGLHAASRAMTAVYRPILEELGLTYPQYLVMLLLWEDEPRLVKELGRTLELDSGTLSPLIKRLETAGGGARGRAGRRRSVRVWCRSRPVAVPSRSALDTSHAL
jgi:hypothetical protein